MGFLTLVLFVLGIWLWAAVLGARKRLRSLEGEVRRLALRLAAMQAQAPAQDQAPAAQLQPQPVAPAAATAPPPPRPPVPAPPPEIPLETVPAAPPAPSIPAVREGAISAPLPRPEASVIRAEEPAGPAAPPPAAPVAQPVPPDLSGSEAPPPRPAPAARPPPRIPPVPAPPFDPLAVLRRFDWEKQIGVKLFSVLAGLAVAGASLSLILVAVERGFITPPVRFALLLLLGVGLAIGSELPFARRYRLTAESLAAGGIVSLFGAFFAAHSLWGLLGALPTFLCLVLVTATAVLLSVRRSSLVVAVLGLLGGFAAPYLVSTGQNRPFGLFGYLLLLNVALAWVSWKRRWPILPWLTLALTALYQAGWVAKFLDRSQLPIAIGVFLVFPVVGFVGIWLSRRPGLAETPPLFRWAAVAGAVPPALFAVHLAGSSVLEGSWPLLFGFLAVISIGLAVVAAWQGPEWLHLAAGGAVLLAVSTFVTSTFTDGDWPLLAAFVALLVAIQLGLPFLLERLGHGFRAEGRLGVLVAPLLLVSFAAVARAPTAAAPVSFLLPLLLLSAACSGVAVLRTDARVHVLASAMAILGAACWSAAHLGPERIYPALLAYLALGALFLGAPLLAERRGKPLAGAAGGPLLLGALCLLVFVARGPVSGGTVGSLVGLTVLVGLFQAGLFAEAVRGHHPLLALVGVVIGFVELAMWAVTGLVAAVLPGLLAAAALTGVAVAGALLAASRQRTPAAARQLSFAPFLGLTGHVFVAVVAARHDLALPPAPWLAVLGVLDLGFLVAALRFRRSALLLGASLATLAVLAAHLVGLGLEAPAPEITAGAVLGAAALFLAGWLLARRTGAEPTHDLGLAGIAALAALHGGQLLVLLGGAELPLVYLVATHLLLLLGLLALAWISGTELVTLSAALLAGLAAPGLWSSPTGIAPLPGTSDAPVLWLATPIWIFALGYPLLRGERGRRERIPFVAAALASGIYLLVARRALVGLGAGPYIGALPVLQAALLVPHLRLVLRLEPATERDLGRLALVAASILALVTVAIPLQLEKQWWTIGWALLATALAWLWGRIPHRGLLTWTAALLAASFVRLVPFLNVWILDYHARGQVPIWNWYLYAYLLVAGAHFAAAWLLSRGADRLLPRLPRLSTLAAASGAVLLFLLLNVEIADYWSQGSRITFRFSAGLAPDLSYTIGWALFAVALLVAGVLLRSRGPRIASIALLAVTVVKGFLHDLAHLSGLYRVASLFGMAICLALVAVVLQRFVLQPTASPPSPPPEPPPEPPPAPPGPEAP